MSTPGSGDSPAKDADADDALPLPIERPQTPRERGGAWRVLLQRAVFVPLIMVLLFTGGVLGMYFQPPGLRAFFARTGLLPGGGSDTPIAVSPDAARNAEDAARRAASQRDVIGLGRLLPRGDIITLAPPFGAGDARLDELHVRVGDRVAEGELVALLDNRSQLQGMVDTARATVAVREATLEQTESSVTTSRSETSASLRRATATADDARKEVLRLEDLVAKGVAPSAELDRARTALTQAEEDVRRTKATLSRYQGREQGTQADVLVATKNVESARAELARAERELRKSEVRAPAAGTVLDIAVRPGEKPGPGGLMKIGNLDEMIVEVEIFQTEIGKVEVGVPVEVVAEALPERLHGSVERIGLEVGRQSMISTDPAASTDARVVKVYVALDAASSELAQTFSNLEVVARIQTVTEGE